jgi:hypothetical protein
VAGPIVPAEGVGSRRSPRATLASWRDLASGGVP